MIIKEAIQSIERELKGGSFTLSELEALKQLFDIAQGHIRNALRAAEARQSSMVRLLGRAKHHPDRWVCRIVYCDAHGKRTRRLISPTAMKSDYVSALDCGREEPRNFQYESIESCELVEANEVLMGTESVEVLS
ncbi:MAG: hypothetical protein AAFX06_24175 [Planctomycetota bacterium]